MRVVVVAALAASLVAACGVGASPPPVATPAAASAAASQAAQAATAAPAPPASQPDAASAASPTPAPIAACDPAGTAASPAPATTAKPVHVVLPSSSWAVAQTEITSPAGVRVLTDVATPSDLTKPATRQDILLTTHHDPDHWNDTWALAFPGRAYPGGQPLVRKDVRIATVQASHFGGTIPDGSDTIFVIDVAGLRIVNFGDLGQDALNTQQLAAIGRPDLAFSQLSNDYSSMSLENRNGYVLMAQVCPRLFIPTHMMEGDALAKLAAETWPTAYTTAPALDLTRSMLPARTTVLLAGANAGMGKTLGLPVFGS
jgi:hypothetical protein